jgi:putative addiction module component (TIGR02574 family)
MCREIGHMTKQQIIDSVKQLSREEQLDLAREIRDLAENDDGDVQLSNELRAELDRRAEAFRRNPQDTRPWHEIKQEILRELHKS